MVDGTGLENRHTLTGIGGSNPSLSAIIFRSLGYARDFGCGLGRPQNASSSNPSLSASIFWSLDCARDFGAGLRRRKRLNFKTGVGPKKQ